MREDLLHFVWKHQKLPLNTLHSNRGERIFITSPGQHNFLAGPDFFNAKVNIKGQLWAGNVEMHIKSSDWYAHGHENDSNYDNVILHVVWEDDIEVFRKDGSLIPTLELKNVIPKSILKSYEQLLFDTKNKFINCEQDFSIVSGFVYENWLERLYVERLEDKSKLIFELLKASQNDWEKTLFCLLMKNFGLNVNGGTFLSIASKLDFTIVRKTGNNLQNFEALLLGFANLLEDPSGTDVYFLALKREFDFLKTKFQLKTAHIIKPAFFGLRPNNFPTIRLSQIANLYHKSPNLFIKVIETKSVEEIRALFEIAASPYWDNHYTFGKKSKTRRKKLTKNFVDLLIINTVVPIKFCYAKHLGKENTEELLNIICALKPEKNTIIERFDNVSTKTMNAMHSQSKLQLYNAYCSKNKCLQCAIGTELLNRKG